MLDELAYFLRYKTIAGLATSSGPVKPETRRSSALQETIRRSGLGGIGLYIYGKQRNENKDTRSKNS